ncbi:MAG: hypothetical protein VB064_12925 [Oscillospiraceae bacterium]|nr:hypothetical protein [Oscillospiraceae bacterium]
MNDTERGLYDKYSVIKNDTGLPIDGPAFILRPDRDPAAVTALTAYAKATDNKQLSEDILNWITPDKKVMILPCKVGDTVKATVLRPYNGHTDTIFGEVIEIQPVVRVRYNQCRHIDFIAPDFGKTVFLALSSAEAALAAKS